MSSKISAIPIVGAHLDTLRDARDRSTKWVDVVIQYLLPVVAGVACYLGQFHLQGVGDVIAGLAVLAALLFALVIFVFQLRLQLANDPRVPKGGLLPTLVDELFANVAYAVLIGLSAVVVSLAASSTRSLDERGNLEPLNAIWSAVLVVVAVHLLLTVGMCLKRTHSAYRELTK